MSIRPIDPSDRVRLAEIVSAVGNFTPQEIETAMEVIDEGLAGSGRGDYFLNVLEEGGRVIGYECHGPTPLTDGTYDLYWIAVDPTSQKGGHGRALLQHAEDDVRRRRGRLLLIETSSQESYNATKRFYERSGYPLVAQIPDFYRRGDDKLVYAKYLEG